MALHEELSDIDRLDATATLFGVVQSARDKNELAGLHERMSEEYPGLFGLPIEISELLKASGRSPEYVEGAGYGAYLVVRSLIQYADADALRQQLPDMPQ